MSGWVSQNGAISRRSFGTGSEANTGFRRYLAWVSSFRHPIAVIFGVLGLLAVSAALITMLWANHEFTYPESVVAAQSLMLKHDGTLYYDLNRFPYTVCAYMPIFYLLEAGASRLGMWVYTAGRLFSFLAFLGILWLVWRLLKLYTRDSAYAWTGVLLCSCTNLLLNWGTVGQVDTLAVFFAIAAFYAYSRYAVNGENTLVWAAGFAFLAFFTKQTAVACPAAIFVLLLLKRPRIALLFGAGLGSAVLAATLAINVATQGRFLSDTLYANLNPFAIEKLDQHVRYLLIASGQLILILVLGLRKAIRGPLFIYLALSTSILALTAPKIGSDSNYQIEFTVLLILCACLSLHALDFFALCRSRSRTFVTLLQLPLAIHVVLNLRIFEGTVAARILHEQLFRSQAAALERVIGDNGRVLSTDMDLMVHLRGRIEAEPLIYKLLVAGGRIDPEPLRRELAETRFPAIVLYENVQRELRDRDPELPTLPDQQLAAIRENYVLAEHIPGPYLNGIYVYKPIGRYSARR